MGDAKKVRGERKKDEGTGEEGMAPGKTLQPFGGRGQNEIHLSVAQVMLSATDSTQDPGTASVEEGPVCKS